jgi:DNA primase
VTESEKHELIRSVGEYGVEKIMHELGAEQVSVVGDRVYSVCPFHKGADNPQGFYYANGFGFCFTGCKRKYDIFEIVKRMKQCDFPESVDYLAGRVGMDIMFRSPLSEQGLENLTFTNRVKKVRQRPKKKSICIDPVELRNFTPSLHKRLRNEGYDEKTRDEFDIGYARSGYLQGRITIPVDLPSGEILTVVGRSVDDEIPKYKAWFDIDKDVTLYNISRAGLFADIEKCIYVVEGFKSVWRLHQWGYYNAVAVMSSFLSETQKRLLQKTNTKVYACGDNDKAGKLFNQEVVSKLHRTTDVVALDIGTLSIPESYSPSDITKEQWEILLEE